jgi:hypothetical protein
MSVALIIRTIGVVYINNKQRKKWKTKHKMQNFNILNFGNGWLFFSPGVRQFFHTKEKDIISF